jgi:type II secretory pathway pseudopilin PulG
MKKLNKGQSLFELVVAIGISALVIVVLVSLVSSALQNAAFAKNQTLSVRYAQEASEWLRGQRDTDTNAFVTNVSAYPYETARCFNSLNWTSVGPCGVNDKISDLFTRQISFNSTSVVIDGETKNIIEADITVSWTDSKGIHQVTNSTNLSDWRQRQ